MSKTKETKQPTLGLAEKVIGMRDRMLNTFKSAYNMRDVMPDKQRFTKPSKTVPDQALSIEEVMKRLMAGIPVNSAREVVFNGDDVDLPDLERMDLSERHDYIKGVQDALKAAQKKRDEIAQFKQEKRNNRLIELAAEKKYKEQQQKEAAKKDGQH